MPGRLPTSARLLWAIPMKRWNSTLGTLLLVLMLWTGATVHAAERTECPPASIEMVPLADGQRTPAPAQPDSNALHQHLGCSGHHLAAPDTVQPEILAMSPRLIPADRQAMWQTGDEPGLTLRPPIA